MFTRVHLASGKLVHAYFKGKNSTDKGKFSLRNRINLQSNVCEVNWNKFHEWHNAYLKILIST
jgi:hypothetical protein